MGVMLPPEAAGMMRMLGPYPSLDEDDVRLERDAVRTANAGTITAASGADAAVRATQQVYHGLSAAAMQRYWDAAGVQGGHVAQANAALRMVPPALEAAASVVSGVKVAAGTQAIYASYEVARLLAFGGVAGPTAAFACVLARRQAVGKILREGSKGTDNVIAPVVRRITGMMRRIQDNLRRPGGPGGPRPALAGAGGRDVPMRPTGLRPPSGPRSVQDGIAERGKKGRRSGGGGDGDRDRYTSRHAGERMEQRDVSSQQVKDALSSGNKSPGSKPGTTRYEKDGLVVIRSNETLKVITTFWRRRK
jgi:hypothetical protein